MAPFRQFPPGPIRRQGSVFYGGTPLTPPLVSAVGVNNLTATSANIVGSINPQGQAGSWWFVYGTTPQFGSTTATTAVGATSLPQTVSVQLTGLTTGATYYFALVGQTPAGTVTSAPLTFVAATPQTVTNAANVPAPLGTPLVSIPHYRFPITFNAASGVGVVEQDTLDEVFSNVQSIMACEIGACPELPTFGRPDVTFSQVPVNPAGLLAAIRRWEPRATASALSQPVLGVDPDGGTWQVAVTTGLAESGQ